MTQPLSYGSTLPNGLPVQVHAPTTGGPLPVVALVHGSHCRPAHYARYCAALAGEGFVVVAPEQVREVFGRSAHFPQQAFVNWAHDFAVAEHTRAGSPVADRVDTDRLFLTGHSMGGGATLGVVSDVAQVGLVDDEWSRPPQLRGALVHGTHNIPPPRPGSHPGGPRTSDPVPVDTQVPLGFVQGTADGVVTLDQSRRTFDAVGGALPRLFVELAGGNHFFLTDSATPEGANADPTPATLDQDASVTSAARWSALWFRACTGDADALAALRAGAGADEPHVSVELLEA